LQAPTALADPPSRDPLPPPPGSSLTITNLSNGKSTSVNISGPGFSSVTSNQLAFSGTSLIIVNPGGLGPGAPGAMLLTRGPATATFDNTGAIVALDLTSASTTDLCAALS
jgi:hypothetical protein